MPTVPPAKASGSLWRGALIGCGIGAVVGCFAGMTVLVSVGRMVGDYHGDGLWPVLVVPLLLFPMLLSENPYVAMALCGAMAGAPLGALVTAVRRRGRTAR